MDQAKIGAFLKMLRKEKGLTQEQLAEHFNVAGRTVSRWETGYNLPDLSVLVELADFYHLDIREIIDGERKDENMDKEMKDTLVRVAEYSDAEKKRVKSKTLGWLLSVFGVGVVITAMAVFPSESSWGSVYATFGAIILAVGTFFLLREYSKVKHRIVATLICFAVLMSALVFVDYLGVKMGGQVPRFRYETFYTSEAPDQLVYKAPFYTVIRHNIDTPDEYIEIK